MEHDDNQIGRILTRREVIKLFGMASASVLVGCELEKTNPSRSNESTQIPKDIGGEISSSVSTSRASPQNLPSCIVRPEQTIGPYFVDVNLKRSDIRSDPSDGSVKEGLPLELTFHVSKIGIDGCVPLEGAVIDLWNCDAFGVYSGVRDPNFNTVGQKFLRGYQVTDANGIAEFTTIYPGWYRGRTAHVHFRIRNEDSPGKNYEFASQLYFDDEITDQVYQLEPYSSRRERTLRNHRDYIFRRDGEQLILRLNETEKGYKTNFNIGLELV